jgi:hypothetical protein
MVLPLDVLFLVIKHYANQSTLYNMGMTSHCISSYAIQQLWQMPYITTAISLDQFSATLSLPSTLYPYKEWVTGLAIHLQLHEDNNKLISGSVFSNLRQQLKLEILSLQQIHVQDIISITTFKNFIAAQLDQGMSDLHLYECTPMTVGFILEALTKKERPFLRRLCFHDCHLTDLHIEQLVSTCQHLQTLLLERCGCLSDSSMTAIANSCQQLNTLVVTLPTNFIQSNTITIKTIEALEKNCLSLKQFVCGGQIRISEYVRKERSTHHHFQITVPDSHWV